MAEQKIGVLVMSYGTPVNMEDIKEYYTHIRRGISPSPEQLADLTSRYEAIVGGFFPLRRNTDRQVEALQETLNRIAPDKYVCFQGLKHARPYIEDGVMSIAKAGLQEAVGIVLAPHYSVMSVGGYIKRAKETAESASVRMRFVESYHLHPKLIEALSVRVRNAFKKFGAGVDPSDVLVLFSAHSLPQRILEMNDPYPQQLLDTSSAVAEAAGVADWRFTWQSAGQTREPWLGPDILDTLQEIREKGARYVMSAPIGFVSDHLEVLYDVDIEAKTAARELGMKLERIDMLNTDPLYMETLAECLIQAT